MSNVPKIRFKEFNGEWEIKKLGELADICTGKKDTKDKVEDGTYPFFVRSQTIERINSYSFDGEAILTAGDGVGVGKVFHYINGKFDYHQRVYKLSNFKERTNGRYIYEYFKNNFIREVTKYTAKTSVDSVRMEMITKMDIPHPSLQEQEKIAFFLSLIDDKINLQSEKVKYLKDYKKGLMQKIFSRELRFKDENGNDYPEWKITTIEKIAKLEKGFTPNTNNEKNWKGDILWLSISDMKQGKYISYVSKSISREALGNKKLIPKGTLIMSFKLTLGRLAIIDVPMVTNEAICHFYWKNNNISTEYMYYYLNTVNIKSFGSCATKGITLNNDSLNSIRIYLPIFDEQIKIATVLSSLDEKIEREQKKLDSLTEYKKGLLQQMFV